MSYANVEWQEHVPRSRDYGDFYYSTAGGLEETRHVYLEQNNLREAFKTHKRLRIAELGFGTGLNFLATWCHWLKYRNPGTYLHYTSFERHPMQKADMEKALSYWPELSSLKEALLLRLPSEETGVHDIHFDGEQLSLSLWLGDARELLAELRNQIHIWYFDGFSPEKNPELWSEEIFRNAARVSAPGASFATYSSKSRVRKALLAAGFDVETTAGFGPKREMLKGWLRNRPEDR